MRSGSVPFNTVRTPTYVTRYTDEAVLRPGSAYGACKRHQWARNDAGWEPTIAHIKRSYAPYGIPGREGTISLWCLAEGASPDSARDSAESVCQRPVPQSGWNRAWAFVMWQL